ncbi:MULTISPECIES: L,D-transpeptidase [unclassified Variovorax]|uniref:L,D-transpeptidase n=1 Tax=unclassified Variovorax TaxID=663243 RepID=UPI001F060A9C|nr:MULTISPECIES: L,D-transpeptidase [unclassified Variovorax]
MFELEKATAPVPPRRVAAGLICAAMLSVTQSLAAAPLNSGQNASDNNSKRERRATQSTEVAQLLDRILQKRDNHGKPFAIVDKKNARVDVFASDGTRQGSSAVLLGLAKGDDSVPGIGERKMADIKPSERTTPAGRFEVEPGRNTQGEDIIWIDYDAAVSMHRVRTANKADRRLERLATPSVADNRISYGCINVPSAFYNAVLRDALGSIGGVVYVLPETRTLQSQFVGLMELKKP